MGQYAMSDKEFCKFKAKVPKAVQSSFESMVDEVVKEFTGEESGTVSGIGIVKEFTVTGNKLTPTVSVSMHVDVERGLVNGIPHTAGASGSSIGSGGKKRPRDCNSAFDNQNQNQHFGDEGGGANAISNSDEQQQQLSYSFNSRHEGEEEDHDDHDHDDYSEEDYDEDDEDHVVGVCLHCGLEPPPAYSDSYTHDNSVSSNTAPGIQVSCDDCHSFICSACHWCHEYQANHEIRVCDRCDAFYCKKCDEMDQCEDCGEVVCGGCGALCSCKFCGCGLCEDCATACGRCGIVLCQRDAKFAVECDTCKMSYCLVCLASGTKDPCVRCGHRTSKRVEQLVHLRLKSIYKAFKQSGAALDNNSKGDVKKGSDLPTLKVGTTRGDIKAMPMTPGELPNDAGEYNNNGIGVSPMNGDVGAVLQVAAAAAASVAASGKGSRCESSSSKESLFGGLPQGVDASKVMPHLNHDGSISFRPRKEPKKNNSDKFASRTQAEADAAAAALLAELDEEKEQVEATTKAKKSKKKKKKERQAAKEKEKEELAQKEAEEMIQRKTKKGDSKENSENLIRKIPKKKKKGAHANVPPSPVEDSNNDESEEDYLMRFAEATGIKKIMSKSDTSKDQPQEDDVESRLAKLITANNLDGIEEVLAQLKGVPGRAPLRKNAKKASKRIREEQAAAEEAKKQKDISSRAGVSSASKSVDNIGGRLWKPTDPLIDFVKKNHRVKPASGGAPRSECVMQLAPHVVGWVIGKGGQRIRDLMEDSGAKVWIDQESMGAKYMRIVYVSGSNDSVVAAVKTIKDLVASAPTPGTTAPSNNVQSDVNDNGGVASSRSHLTSTPVSVSRAVFQASRISPVMKRELRGASVKTQNNSDVPHTAISKQGSHVRKVSSPSSPSRNVSMPPLGIETMLGSSSPIVNSSQANAPKVVHELFCEKKYVPLLIGRRGWTVKNIQDTSGARVDIDQKVSPRRIIISGTESQVKDAIRKVGEVLKYPNAQLNYSTTGPDGVEIVGTLAAMQSVGFSTSQEKDIVEQSLFGLGQGQSLPLDYGALPNRLSNDPMTQHTLQQQSSFHQYGEQDVRQQPLPGHLPSPQQPFPTNITSSTNASPVFLNTQRPTPLHGHNIGLQLNQAMNAAGVGVEPFDRNFLRGTYVHDQQLPPPGTIMPLSAGNQGNFDNVSPGSSLFSGHQQSNNNALLNNIFGNPVRVPSRTAAPADRQSGNIGADLLQGFGSMSFGENGNNDVGLEPPDWDWDGLMNDESSSGRRVGLGGVRLDTSAVESNNSNTATSTSQWRY